MAGPSVGPWEIFQPPQLDPQLAALAGKRAGLARRLTLLSEDACHPDVDGYRLSGPLAPIVCGAHLDRGYRFAYSTQPALARGEKPRVVVLYVGKREPGHRARTDVWDVLHDIFGVGNPPAGHDKPPCCNGGAPEIGIDDLREFLKELQRFNRGR